MNHFRYANLGLKLLKGFQNILIIECTEAEEYRLIFVLWVQNGMIRTSGFIYEVFYYNSSIVFTAPPAPFNGKL